MGVKAPDHTQFYYRAQAELQVKMFAEKRMPVVRETQMFLGQSNWMSL